MLGWNQEKFEKYELIVKPVYSYKQILEENLGSIENIFSNQSIILFHESFFEQVSDSNKNDSLKIRNKLINWCLENKIPLVKFSGSINTRIQNGVNVSLSVKVLYQNLEFFLKSIYKKILLIKAFKFFCLVRITILKKFYNLKRKFGRLNLNLALCLILKLNILIHLQTKLLILK